MDKQKNTHEIEIDLLPIFKKLLSKVWLMILVGAVFAGLAFGATKAFIKPTYRCSFTAYVNNQHSQSGTGSLSQSDINAAKQLVNTYVKVIKSNAILTAAAEAAGMDVTYGKLQKMVSAEVQGETEIIAVYVVDEDPETAYILANAIAKIAPSYMTNIVEGSSMKIIDYPMYNDSRYKPNYLKYALLAFLIGVVLVIIKVVIDYFRDDNISDESELENRFGLPILGIIPDVLESTAASKKGGYYAYNYAYKSDDQEKR